MTEPHRRVVWVFSDVDGVLTDGGMYYGEDGERLKRFNTRDGMGGELLRAAGFKVGWLTRERSRINDSRAAKLCIDVVLSGVRNKLEGMETFVREQGLNWDQIAYIGDERIDLEVLLHCRVSGAPSDAVGEVRDRVTHVCRARGGEGAFREFAEFILDGRAKMKW